MVCLGNICRSPTAEAMLRKKCTKRARRPHRGRFGRHRRLPRRLAARPARRRARRERGLQMKHLRGRQVSRADFDRFDFILAMDDDNLDELRAHAPAGLARDASRC